MAFRFCPNVIGESRETATGKLCRCNRIQDAIRYRGMLCRSPHFTTNHHRNEIVFRVVSQTHLSEIQRRITWVSFYCGDIISPARGWEIVKVIVL